MASLQESLPELHRQLRQVERQLELLFRDAQDFEFTVQEGRLYLLQSRGAKRTAWAALRIACEQVAEGLIDEPTALERLAGYDLNSIQLVRLAVAEGCRPIGMGVAASPGVAVGEAVFDPDEAVRWAGAGRSPILIRTVTSTGDIAGLAASAGLLTARGDGPRMRRSSPASSTRSASSAAGSWRSRKMASAAASGTSSSTRVRLCLSTASPVRSTQANWKWSWRGRLNTSGKSGGGESAVAKRRPGRES